MIKKRLKTGSVRIYFMVPAAPGISPAQRFRFEHYLPFLKEYNISYKISSFYSLKDWSQLYRQGGIWKKGFIVLKGFGKRILDLFRVARFDYVYIHREAAPIGPPVFEFIVRFILRKRIIYDFDDAIWIPVSSSQNKIAFHLRWFSKVASICRWSYTVSVGNDFLASWASKHNPAVIVLPTVVDTVKQHNKLKDQSKGNIVIGWTGTFSTLKYLEIVVPVLQSLQENHAFTFTVISDQDPALPLKNYQFIRWNKETEIEDLLRFHIGLMPLDDSDIERGKCGFKAIQYMSLGIPAVVSGVGVNAVLVDDGINGFIASSPEEWKEKIAFLLEHPEARSAFGIQAREKIVDHYSVSSTLEQFAALFLPK